MVVNEEMLASYVDGTASDEVRTNVRNYLERHPDELEVVLLLMDRDKHDHSIHFSDNSEIPTSESLMFSASIVASPSMDNCKSFSVNSEESMDELSDVRKSILPSSPMANCGNSDESSDDRKPLLPPPPPRVHYCSMPSEDVIPDVDDDGKDDKDNIERLSLSEKMEEPVERMYCMKNLDFKEAFKDELRCCSMPNFSFKNRKVKAKSTHKRQDSMLDRMDKLLKEIGGI